MATATKTLAAIDRAVVVTEQQEERRKHLGASIIGRKCERQVWYMFRWALREKFEGRMLRLFNRGHREEDNFIRLLRAAGITVWAAGESGEFKERMRVSACNGHFGGTPDAWVEDVPDLGEVIALAEFKTHNDVSFKKLKSEGLCASKYEHFVQMQIYMHGHGQPVGLYFAVNKDTDEMHCEIVPYQIAVATRFIERAQGIIDAVRPPKRINESPGFWVCKFCAFVDLCHFDHIHFPEPTCRSCAYASPGPQGTWACAKGRVEIAEQLGCPSHIHDPRWHDNWEVLGGNFEENWIEVWTGTEKMRLGPKWNNSADLFKDGLIPF